MLKNICSSSRAINVGSRTKSRAHCKRYFAPSQVFVETPIIFFRIWHNGFVDLISLFVWIYIFSLPLLFCFPKLFHSNSMFSKILEHRSAQILLLVNLIPLVGVIFLGWNLFLIMFFYWSESLIIGFFNVLKLIKVTPYPLNFFLPPFFTIHYGGFMTVHLIFIWVFFSGPGLVEPVMDYEPAMAILLNPYVIANWFLLFLSHAYSYFFNFLGNSEYKILNFGQLMMSPYKRIFVMHLTILLGGFASFFLGLPPIAFVVMIFLKIVVDLWGHGIEHKFVAKKSSGK